MTEQLMGRDQQLNRILEVEHQTGVYVPRFLVDLPPVDKGLAIRVAEAKTLPAIGDLLNRFKHLGGPPQDLLEKVKAESGLRYIRSTGLMSEMELLNTQEEREYSSLELFEYFKNPKVKEHDFLTEQELKRRIARDDDILRMELALLRRRGIEAPQFDSLLEYCEWIPEGTGYNEKVRKWSSRVNYTQTAEQVYWDLMGFYEQIFRQAQTSFDPLKDWQDYINGYLDLTHMDSWHLQNVGREDISYFAMSVRWGGGARERPSLITYPGRLLTHSTSLKAANSIMRQKFLRPRICYSANRVVVGAGDKVVFLFDRKRIADTYSIGSYTEPGGEHEHEVRSNEINHIGFCIGCVPASSLLFPDYQGRGEGTTSRGEEVIAKWSKRYVEEGRLWTTEEEQGIREVARSIGSLDK